MVCPPKGTEPYKKTFVFSDYFSDQLFEEYLKKFGSVNHLGGKKEDEDKDMDGIQVKN